MRTKLRLPKFTHMRTLLLLGFGLLITVRANSQEQFQRVYGGESYDQGCEVIQTPDDGYLIAGTTGSFGFSSGQIMLIKTDFQGYEEWRRYYGDNYADQARTMMQTADGNLVIGGFTETQLNSYQALAIKLTMDGDTIWSRSYGGAEWDFCRQVAVLPDSGLALFGQTFGNGAAEGDFLLIRINKDGDTLWTKTYGGPEMESGESIAVAPDGGFYLAGYTSSYGAGKVDFYVVRTDAFGDTLWTKTFGGPEDDFGYAIAITNDGGYVVAGGTFSNTAGKSDFVIYKDQGSIQWTRYSAYLGNDFWTDIIVEPIGNVTAAGYFTEGGAGMEDMRITRYGADGIYNGMASGHGSHLNDRAYDVKLTSDGGYVMVGFTEGFMERFDDVYLVKMNNIGETAPDEVGIDEISINGEVFSVTVGPNPILDVEPTMFIQDYESLISKLDKQMSVGLFNTLGQFIEELPISAGNTKLNVSNLPSGVYSYILKSGNLVLATGKLVKI